MQQTQITALSAINQGVGEVVNAVNNVSGAIGGAIQQANAAQTVINMTWAVPGFASGGTAQGWFVAGDDPLSSRNGELMFSDSPVQIFSNRKSRSMLSKQDSGIDGGSGTDALGRVLGDILSATVDGNDALARVERRLKNMDLARAGQ